MSDTFKRVTLFAAVFVLGFAASQLYTHSANWFASKIQSLETEVNYLNNKVDTLNDLLSHQGRQIDTLLHMHPYKKKRDRWICKDGTFLGFVLYTPVDTSIHRSFHLALSEYTGPKVKVNSLRRSCNRSSAHYHGKAADFELSQELVDWLLSDEGEKWRTSHNLLFYIEGKPGSKRVRKYLNDPRSAKYVFFNPRATGDHIHIANA